MAIKRIGVKAHREFAKTLLDFGVRVKGERDLPYIYTLERPHELWVFSRGVWHGGHGPLEVHMVTREQFVAAALGAWWPEDPEPEHPTTFEDRWGKIHCIQYESPDLVRFGCQLVTRGLIESILNYMNYLRDKP